MQTMAAGRVALVGLVAGAMAAGLWARESHAQPLDPCVEAAALVDARLPTADKALWFKFLETCAAANGPKILQSVQESIQQRERGELALGEEATREGQLKAAAAHFEAALALEPTDSAAAVHLRDARAVLARQAAEEAKELLAAGKMDDALKVLSESGAPAAGERHPWFNQLDRRAWLAANAQFWLEVIAFVIVLLVVVYRWWRRNTTRHVVELRDFSNNALAPGIEQAIQAMLINLSRGSGVSASAGLRVTRPLQGVALPVDISKVLPASVSWIQVIPGLMQNVFPRRTLPISGVLHQDPAKGAGITIHVINQDKEDRTETFWQSQYGDVATAKKNENAHHELAEYVAIWLLFEFSDRGFALLGTTRWRAYALFRAGVNAAVADSAKAFYLSALRVDDNIHAARLNIGLLAQTEERPFVADLFECAADKAEASDATRYQARYSLASLRYDLDADADRAIAQMKTLFKSLSDTCERFHLKTELKQQSDKYYAELACGQATSAAPATLQAPVRGQLQWLGSATETSHQELEQYIEYLLPIARTMSLGLLIAQHHDSEAALGELWKIAREDQSPRVSYNLACSYSLVAQGLSADLSKESADRGKDPEKVKQLHVYLKLGLESLGLALWLSPGIGKKARDDKGLAGLRNSMARLDKEKDTTVGESFEQIVTRYVGPASGSPQQMMDEDCSG